MIVESVKAGILLRLRFEEATEGEVSPNPSLSLVSSFRHTVGINH